MKTLIILKGLVKRKKLEWVEEQGLTNFFLDYDALRRLYYKPEISQGDEVLVRSKDNLLYEHFLRILCLRLDLGCLVCVDLDTESGAFLESLAIVYGYHIFYKTFQTPSDFSKNYKNYGISYYPKPTRSELQGLTGIFSKKELKKLPDQIDCFQDILDYWRMNGGRYKKIVKGDILHISDLHSNWSLYRQINCGCSTTMFHGDYIDGPEVGGSRKLMDLALYCPDRNTIFLEGNHEIRLRKYLGSKWLYGSKKTLSRILRESIPEDFMNRTAPDFSDIAKDPIEAKQYLVDMNRRLREFIKILRGNEILYCTHSGFRSLSQIDPRYIGNVIYGSRNMDKIDSQFSRQYSDKGIWSIHAHCQYPNIWNPTKYRGVLNIDPEDENTICYFDGKQVKTIKA